MINVGLAFDKNTCEIIDLNEYNDSILDNLDGTFLYENDDILLMDTSGYIPVYYNYKNNSIITSSKEKIYDIPYQPLPYGCIFDKNTRTFKFYRTFKTIDNIWEYFEDWFSKLICNIKKIYNKMSLSVTSGLDSRYLYAILKSRNINVDLISYNSESNIVQKYIRDVTIYNIDKKLFLYMKDFLMYYKNNRYSDIRSEFYPYCFYKEVSKKYDIIIDGLGRNYFLTYPRLEDSYDVQQIRTSFTAGRVPCILEGNLKPIYPFAATDIRYNFRRLNMNEKEIVENIYERIQYLSPELINIPTNSFKKAESDVKKVNDDYISLK